MIWIPEHLYDRCQKIAKQNDIEVDALVNGILDAALEEYKGINIMEVTQVG